VENGKVVGLIKYLQLLLIINVDELLVASGGVSNIDL
jgi:hypothetical protein